MAAQPGDGDRQGPRQAPGGGRRGGRLHRQFQGGQPSDDPGRRESTALRGFTDLFDAEGQEIHIKPAADYVLLSTEVSYATVVAAARAYGEVAIGYRSGRGAGGLGETGIVLNPPKSGNLIFQPGDMVIVLADG
jgi:hypothetical protein